MYTIAMFILCCIILLLPSICISSYEIETPVIDILIIHKICIVITLIVFISLVVWLIEKTICNNIVNKPQKKHPFPKIYHFYNNIFSKYSLMIIATSLIAMYIIGNSIFEEYLKIFNIKCDELSFNSLFSILSVVSLILTIQKTSNTYK